MCRKSAKYMCAFKKLSLPKRTKYARCQFVLNGYLLPKIKPMLTYVLLFICVAIVILGVIRASKQNPSSSTRSPKEPFIGEAAPPSEGEEIETVGKPRIIRHAPTRHADAVEHASAQRTPHVHASPPPLRAHAATASMHKESTSSTARNNSIENTETIYPMGLKKSDSRPSHETEEQHTHVERSHYLPPTEHSVESVHQMERDAIAAAPPSAPTRSSTEAETTQQPEIDTDILVLHLLAETGCTYKGYALLQALLTAGLRYGKWGIFHRHEERTGRGSILFSLASSVEPGTFDLAKMSGFATPALTLFMRISAVKNPTQAFETLLTAAHQLVEELGGTLCDETRNPLSMEKLTLWRAQLK
jgi:cell division protein ZipA